MLWLNNGDKGGYGEMTRSEFFSTFCKNCEIDRECTKGKKCFNCDCNDDIICYCGIEPTVEEVKGVKCAKYKPIKQEFMRPMQDNMKEAANHLNNASLYLGYALARAEIGETRNARLLTEVAERSFLRAFLYIRNALEDAKENEKDR